MDGYKWWYQNYPFKEIDHHVIQFLKIDSHFKEWLKFVRQALFVSTDQIAKSMGISRQAYQKLEQSEKVSSIKISSLERVATALGCELIYAIRPKTKERFSQIIWRQLEEESKSHFWVVSRSPVFKARALAAICRMKMDEPKFRRKKKWTERRS